MPASWTPVVDDVDDVMASHVNTLYDEVELGTYRGWYSRTLSTSDNVTLTDADMPLQFLTAVGGSLSLYLPAEAVANHSFIIVNESSDANTWTVKNDSSDTIGSVAQSENKMVVGNGVTWELMTTGGASASATTDTEGIVMLAGSSDVDAGSSATLAMTPASFTASTRNVNYAVMRFIEAGTDWSADGSTDVGGAVPIPYPGTLVYIKGNSDVAGTSDVAVVDVNLNGTTIMDTNKLKWDSGEKSTLTYSGTAPALSTTAVTTDDLITIDIDTNHTSVKSKGLTITLGIRKT